MPEQECEGFNFDDDLHINYKECAKRGPRNSMEVVYAVSAKKFPVQRDGPRRVCTATTLASNCLVQVDDFSSTASGSQPGPRNVVTRELKEAILGEMQLTEQEKGLTPTGTVFLHHWEKTTACWMEIFHHYGLTSMATVSGGRQLWKYILTLLDPAPYLWPLLASPGSQPVWGFHTPAHRPPHPQLVEVAYAHCSRRHERASAGHVQE